MSYDDVYVNHVILLIPDNFMVMWNESGIRYIKANYIVITSDIKDNTIKVITILDKSLVYKTKEIEIITDKKDLKKMLIELYARTNVIGLKS